MQLYISDKNEHVIYITADTDETTVLNYVKIVD